MLQKALNLLLKINKDFLIVVIIFGLLIGCRTQKSATYKTKDTTNTIEKTTTHRDTVFVTEKATVSLITDCDKLSEIPKTNKNKNATSSLYKNKDGQIVADCECDTLAITAKIKQEFQKETKEIIITETKIEKEKYIPFLIKLLAWIGGIYFAFILGKFLYNKYKNKF